MLTKTKNLMMNKIIFMLFVLLLTIQMTNAQKSQQLQLLPHQLEKSLKDQNGDKKQTNTITQHNQLVEQDKKILYDNGLSQNNNVPILQNKYSYIPEINDQYSVVYSVIYPKQTDEAEKSKFVSSLAKDNFVNKLIAKDKDNKQQVVDGKEQKKQQQQEKEQLEEKDLFVEYGNKKEDNNIKEKLKQQKLQQKIQFKQDVYGQPFKITDYEFQLKQKNRKKQPQKQPKDNQQQKQQSEQKQKQKQKEQQQQQQEELKNQQQQQQKQKQQQLQQLKQKQQQKLRRQKQQLKEQQQRKKQLQQAEKLKKQQEQQLVQRQKQQQRQRQREKQKLQQQQQLKKMKLQQQQKKQQANLKKQQQKQEQKVKQQEIKQTSEQQQPQQHTININQQYQELVEKLKLNQKYINSHLEYEERVQAEIIDRNWKFLLAKVAVCIVIVVALFQAMCSAESRMSKAEKERYAPVEVETTELFDSKESNAQQSLQQMHYSMHRK